MSDEEPPVTEGVLISAKDQLDDDEISLADNEEILHALSELTSVYVNDLSYFVLGNYDREPIRRWYRKDADPRDSTVIVRLNFVLQHGDVLAHC